MMLFGFISLIYRKYKVGIWQGRLPEPEEFDEEEYILWDNESYCLFQKRHKKFGNNIVECANPYSKNAFVFFNFYALKEYFHFLDEEVDESPFVPTYHAHPKDRTDFKKGTHKWELR